MEKARKDLFSLTKGIPYWKLIGFELEEANKGQARLRVRVREELKQIYGVVHGGVMASLADSAIGLAAFTLTGSSQRYATLELKINYLRPAKSGILVADAKVIFTGASITVGEADIKDGEGNLLAKAVATFHHMPMKEKRPSFSMD